MNWIQAGGTMEERMVVGGLPTASRVRRLAWTLCMTVGGVSLGGMILGGITVGGILAGATAGAQTLSPVVYSIPERITLAEPSETGSGQGTQPPVKDDLFAGAEIFAKGASDVTEITMDPDTLDLVGGKDSKRAHNMILNVVRTYSYDKPGMYRMEDVDVFRNKLNTGDWRCSVHTRDMKTGSSTDICNKRRTDGLTETAIITVEPKQLTFIHTIRKKSDSDPSAWSILPLVGPLHGVSSLAMLDPEEFKDMEMAMSHINLNGMNLNSAAIWAQIDSAMKNMPKLDSAEMQRKMEETTQRMKEAQERWNATLDEQRGGTSSPDSQTQKPE
jgi:hypothetical protein